MTEMIKNDSHVSSSSEYVGGRTTGIQKVREERL